MQKPNNQTMPSQFATTLKRLPQRKAVLTTRILKKIWKVDAYYSETVLIVLEILRLEDDQYYL